MREEATGGESDCVDSSAIELVPLRDVLDDRTDVADIVGRVAVERAASVGAVPELLTGFVLRAVGRDVEEPAEELATGLRTIYWVERRATRIAGTGEKSSG
jgi:hypothetical protein